MQKVVGFGLAALELFLQAPAAAQAVPPSAATYEAKMAEGEQQRKKDSSRSQSSFEAAAKLAHDPAQKARALGEVSVIALANDRLHDSAQASCDALAILEGPPRASHLFNLGRLAEALKDANSAAALYKASIALRANATVSAQLGKLGSAAATVLVSAPSPAAMSGDPAKAFCEAALGIKTPIAPAFVNLAKSVASQRSEELTATMWRPLGPRGELYAVAFLCAKDASTGSWMIEVDAAHHFLLAFDELDGRSRLDGCGGFGDELYVGRGKSVALQYYAGYHGGYDDRYLGIRKGRPVVIYSASLDDVRAGDSDVLIDYDERGGSYPDPNKFAQVTLLDAQAKKPSTKPAP